MLQAITREIAAGVGGRDWARIEHRRWISRISTFDMPTVLGQYIYNRRYPPRRLSSFITNGWKQIVDLRNFYDAVDHFESLAAFDAFCREFDIGHSTA